MSPENIQGLKPFSVKADLGATPAQRILQPENDGTPRGSVIDREGNRHNFFVRGLVKQEEAVIREALGNREGKTSVSVNFSGLQESETSDEKLPADIPLSSTGVETGENSAGGVSLDVARKRKEALTRKRVKQYALAASIGTLSLFPLAQQARAGGFLEEVVDIGIQAGGQVLTTEVNRWVGHGKTDIDTGAKSEVAKIDAKRDSGIAAVNTEYHLGNTEGAYNARKAELMRQMVARRTYNEELAIAKKNHLITQAEYDIRINKPGIGISYAEYLDEMAYADKFYGGIYSAQKTSGGAAQRGVLRSAIAEQINIGASDAQTHVRTDASAAKGHWDTAGGGFKGTIRSGVKGAKAEW